jgi:benzoyl-CoA reductase/2-hydroxyglutaryl-CoA dehydratase subunit BcrC/BadD/HgdB
MGATDIKVDLSDFDDVLSKLAAIRDHRKASPTVPSSLVFYESQIEYYRAIRYAHDEGKLLIAHTGYVPVEILHAMDIVPMHLAFVTGATAQVSGRQMACLDAAQAAGYPWELCSAHRLVVGAGLSGMIPRPDAVVSLSFGCTNTATSGAVLGELYNCPIFYLEMPYKSRGDRGRQYWVEMAKELIARLEQLSGRKLDWDRLREAVAIEKQVHSLLCELQSMRKAVPSPIKQRAFVEQFQTYIMMPGKSAYLRYFNMLLDDVRYCYERGISPNGPDYKERYRLVSLVYPPIWCRRFLDWMEEEGITTVAEPHMATAGVIPIDIESDNPLEFLAARYCADLRNFNCPMIDQLLPETIQVARQRKADGALIYAPLCCNIGSPLANCLKQALKEEAGIPTLILDCDSVDPTYVSEDEMKEKVEDFLPIMDSYRSMRRDKS